MSSEASSGSLEGRLLDKVREKTCRACKATKPVAEFCKRLKQKDGLDPCCRVCDDKVVYWVGVDLGQAADYTAICILEDPGDDDVVFDLRYLERVPLHTSYHDIVKRVGDMMDRLKRERCRLAVDATGVGVPVVELFENAALWPTAVTITAGVTSSMDGFGGYHVPKRDLVSKLAVLFQNGRLRVARGIGHGQLFIKELQAFRVKISLSGHDSYEAHREGDHDDLVLAVAIGAWVAERERGPAAVLI